MKFCQATCDISLSANPADAQFISPVLCLPSATLTNRAKKGSQGNQPGADTSPPLPHCFLLAKGHNLQNKLQLQNKEKLPRSAQGTA